MYEDIEEAMVAILTADQAKVEVMEHGLSWQDFTADNGDCASYSGAAVLNWLGY